MHYFFKFLIKYGMFFNSLLKIHFIGICGSGMFPLAKFFKDKGFIVSGSDAVFSILINDLNKFGINAYSGSDLTFVDKSEIVIYSSAINS